MKTLAALGILTLSLPVFASPKTPRPADWISHMIPLEDTRPGRTTPEGCRLEVVELKYDSDKPRAGTVLLLPGLFHDSFLFDLLPESGISYARWVMREKGLQVFMLHTRGIGKSCYPTFSNLDDQAIDDIPAAIRYVSQAVGEKIFVYGHSRGGINMQASLAGLARCGRGENCFRPMAALERQSYVRGAFFMGSNVAMTSDKNTHPLLGIALLDDLLAAPASPVLDRIPSSWLTEYLAPSDGKGPTGGDGSLAYADFWEGTYHIPNVSKEARKAYYDKSMDSTTLPILRQYAHGIKHKGIDAEGGEAYVDGLAYIRVRSAMGVFEFDHYAELGPTERDDYARLGAHDKKLFYYAGEGHEDFALVSDFHAHQSELWDWMLR